MENSCDCESTPHEAVKVVPLCCNCHSIITRYSKGRNAKYAERHSLQCENPTSIELPIGGTVHIAEEGKYYGGFSFL